MGHRLSRLGIVLGAIALAASAGCAADVDDTEEGALDQVDEALTGCSKTIKFGGLTFFTPESWSKEVVNDDVALIGVQGSGDVAMNLVIQRNFEGDIDSIAPESCAGIGGAVPLSKRELVGDKPLPIGAHTAIHRRWKLTCQNGHVETHHAWLLEKEKIAIYEATAVPNNLRVVATAAVGNESAGAKTICTGATKQLSFGALTFRAPESWTKVVEGNKAFIGPPNGGAKDMNLKIIKGFTGTPDKLAPTSCPRDGDPNDASVEAITTIESGRMPAGGGLANYRRWKVKCSDGTTRKQRAWVLPNQKMAIFEQHATDRNLPVVTYSEPH